jgi:integrase
MGLITKRDGRWHATVQETSGEVHRKSFASEGRAKAWVSRFEAAMARLAAPKKKNATIYNTTLGALLERYHREVTPEKKGARAEGYRIGLLLRSDLCAILLFQLAPKHIADYRNERTAFREPQTVRLEICLIRKAIEMARREWGFELPNNPASLVTLPRQGMARERRPDPGELERLEEALAGNPVALALVRFAVHSAMRRGEMLAMSWRHVSFGERMVYLPNTKAGRSRTVPLTDAALEVLKGTKATEERVFPIDEHAFRYAWDTACREAGIVDLRFHDLRHEGVSRLFEMGLDAAEVAQISGHKTIAMLFRYYNLRPYELAEKLKGMRYGRRKARLAAS